MLAYIGLVLGIFISIFVVIILFSVSFSIVVGSFITVFFTISLLNSSAEGVIIPNAYWQFWLVTLVIIIVLRYILSIWSTTKRALAFFSGGGIAILISSLIGAFGKAFFGLSDEKMVKLCGITYLIFVVVFCLYNFSILSKENNIITNNPIAMIVSFILYFLAGIWPGNIIDTVINNPYYTLDRLIKASVSGGLSIAVIMTIAGFIIDTIGKKMYKESLECELIVREEMKNKIDSMEKMLDEIVSKKDLPQSYSIIASDEIKKIQGYRETIEPDIVEVEESYNLINNIHQKVCK